MKQTPHFTIRQAAWPEDADAMHAIRQTVFVEEQNVPPDLEWDGADPQCLHALAVNADGAPIGCGRLLDDGRIGRMAVLREWRGHGVGGALLDYLVEAVRRRGMGECRLNAQTTALEFYRHHGFVAEGPEFPDAGIPHRHMRRRLD